METTKLNGRVYRAIKTSTIEHDFYMIDRIRAAGLDRVTLAEGENAEQLAMRLLEMTIGTGKAFEILGGLLIPVDVQDIDWTPAIAEETAENIKRTTDDAEKAEIRQQLVALLISFFNAGLIVLTSSPNYSASPEKVDADQNTAIGDTTITATGTS